MAAASVEPEPANGSRTMPATGQKVEIIGFKAAPVFASDAACCRCRENRSCPRSARRAASRRLWPGDKRLRAHSAKSERMRRNVSERRYDRRGAIRLRARPPEEMHFVPCVEAHAERCRLEDAIDLPESGSQPGTVVVVGHGAAVARAVIDQIRRVREHEIDGSGLKVSHAFDAVGVNDGVHGIASFV